MSNDNKLRNVMMEAHSLCPTDMSHIQRMAWMADYFVQHSALPAEKPAAAAERGAVGLTDSRCDLLAAQMQMKADTDASRGFQQPVSYYVRSALGYARADLPATHPAQAAEPAQVDEPWQSLTTAPDGVRVLLGPRDAPVIGIVRQMPEWADEREPIAHVVHYNGTTLVANYRCSEWAPLAALTQRPADK